MCIKKNFTVSSSWNFSIHLLGKCEEDQNTERIFRNVIFFHLGAHVLLLNANIALQKKFNDTRFIETI